MLSCLGGIFKYVLVRVSETIRYMRCQSSYQLCDKENRAIWWRFIKKKRQIDNFYWNWIGTISFGLEIQLAALFVNFL